MIVMIATFGTNAYQRKKKMPNPFIKETRLIGAHIPVETADHFALIVTYFQTSPLAAIQKVITDYSNQFKYSLLFTEISKKAMENWDGIDFRKYAERVRKILIKKHLSVNHIDHIIMEMRRTYEKDKR